MPDAIFSVPRLAELYDVVDDDRSDLDAYVQLVAELRATSVLDVGCGTGTFACMLARAGIGVVGLDPAEASLDIARRKPGADRVRWIHAGAAATPPLGVDLAVMTGNVAQVFVDDSDWIDALRAVRAAVRDDGWFVFETRDPDRRAWESWTRSETYREIEAPIGTVTTWTELVDVAEPLVTFRHVFRFPTDGVELTSLSTLRFRGRDELVDDVRRAGFRSPTVRDAPDRPGLEFVVVTRPAREHAPDRTAAQRGRVGS